MVKDKKGGYNLTKQKQTNQLNEPNQLNELNLKGGVMKRIGLVLIISGFWLLVSGFYTRGYAQGGGGGGGPTGETIILTTYYPAPYGVYNFLLVQKNAENNAAETLMRFRTSDAPEIVPGSPLSRLEIRNNSTTNNIFEPLIYAQADNTANPALTIEGNLGNNDGVGHGPVVVLKATGLDINNGNVGTRDIFEVRNNNTALLTIEQNGETGIGTTNPDAALQISKTINAESDNDILIGLRVNPTYIDSNLEGKTFSNVRHYGLFSNSDGIGILGSGTPSITMSNDDYNNIIKGTGIVGYSNTNCGVMGYFEGGGGSDTDEYYGVTGNAVISTTEEGSRKKGIPIGIRGESEGYGVKGIANCSYDNSTPRYGVFGEAKNSTTPSSSCALYGLYGKATNLNDTAAMGYGVYAQGDDYGGWFKGPTAGYFEGDLTVTGQITMYAEDAGEPPAGKHVYPGGGTVTPGPGDVAELVQCDIDVTLADVVSIDPSKNMLIKSTTQNDTTVAGIISENPTLAIGSKKIHEKNNPENNYQYIALAGQVYCNVDASYGEINPGDLLTTSPTPGHAMKAKPIGEINGYPIYPQGCIVGKALEELKEGKGKILVLVCLM